MARTSVDMENHSCDSSACTKEAPATAGENHAPAGWLTGTIAQADANGNLPVEAERVTWEACSVAHIRRAAEGALEREGVAADEPEPAASEPSQALENGATRDVTAITARA
jgi:hypothetical protein